MSTTSTQPVAPIALQPGEGDARWFLGALGTIKAAPETTGGELAVIEFLWPHGGGSPLHIHRFVITSAVARFLMVTDPAPFADFVRAGSVPAEALTLAPASAHVPSPEELTAIAAEYGIEVIGPPGIPA